MNEQLSEIIKILSSINHSLFPRPFYLDWSFWNVVVLSITLGVLFLYTKYTHGILIENKKIRQSSFMPFLYFRGNDFNLALKPNNQSFIGYVKFINIGKGPAINVTIDNIEIGYHKIFFKHSLSLVPYQTEFSMITVHFDEIRASGTKLLEKPTKTQSKILNMRCRDQLGNCYLFKYDISNLNETPKYIGYSVC